MLAPAVVAARLIPYGIDLAIFKPGSRLAARQALDLPPDRRILLFVANRGRHNVYKDHLTIAAAVSALARNEQQSPLLLVVLGGEAAIKPSPGVEVRSLPYEHDLRRVAAYFQAADIYLHAARADTFPNTVLEALACGIPVVATAVGGIPEQVEQGRSGFLTPPGDAAAMSVAISRLLDDPDLRARLGDYAAKQAAERFDLARQVRDYLDWYEVVRADFAANSMASSSV